MSVRLLDRNQSRVEFLSNFHNIRKEIELLLMRDFGLKKRKYETALMEEIYQMSEEDKQAYENLMARIGAKSSIIDKYPSWLIDNWRQSIMSILDNLGTERERKAIRKFQEYLQVGRMKQKDIINSYNSWRGNIIQYDCKKSVQSMDRYFIQHIGGLYE